jgi:hypothetical protein
MKWQTKYYKRIVIYGNPMLVKCKSGQFLAYFNKHSNVVSNGQTKREAKDNLTEMFASINCGIRSTTYSLDNGEKVELQYKTAEAFKI